MLLQVKDYKSWIHFVLLGKAFWSFSHVCQKWKVLRWCKSYLPTYKQEGIFILSRNKSSQGIILPVICIKISTWEPVGAKRFSSFLSFSSSPAVLFAWDSWLLLFTLLTKISRRISKTNRFHFLNEPYRWITIFFNIPRIIFCISQWPWRPILQLLHNAHVLHKSLEFTLKWKYDCAQCLVNGRYNLRIGID